MTLIRIVWLLLKYSWIYLKVSVSCGKVWGSSSDVISNDVRLRNFRPMEWEELQSIKRHIYKLSGYGGEEE